LIPKNVSLEVKLHTHSRSERRVYKCTCTCVKKAIQRHLSVVSGAHTWAGLGG
jgi:hypothetical protein